MKKKNVVIYSNIWEKFISLSLTYKLKKNLDLSRRILDIFLK